LAIQTVVWIGRKIGRCLACLTRTRNKSKWAQNYIDLERNFTMIFFKRNHNYSSSSPLAGIGRQRQLHVIVIWNDDLRSWQRVNHLPVWVILSASTRDAGRRRHLLPSYRASGGAYDDNGGGGGREAMCSATIPVSSMA
jgi:hypothetical protein